MQYLERLANWFDALPTAVKIIVYSGISSYMMLIGNELIVVQSTDDVLVAIQLALVKLPITLVAIIGNLLLWKAQLLAQTE